MSRSSRRRSSKWDLAEEPQFENANVQENGWMGKEGRSFHHKESGREWVSSELAGSNGSKWSGLETNDMQRSKHDMGLPSREPLPGSRGSHKKESINRYIDDSVVWEGDENCSTRMSPGLHEWRRRIRSPRSGWTRSLRGRSRSRSWSRSRSQSWSRSRSPDRGYRRESLFVDRNRRGSGVPTQTCKDFSAGKCRRASDCQFLHEGRSNYDDSWETRQRKGGASKCYISPDTDGDYPLKSGRSSVYCTEFAKGKCRKGASCNFDHHRASDGFSKGSKIESSREREIERRKRDASTERCADRVPLRSSDIPCKFFAAGNCRNKRYCRFSHHIQACVSPERKSGDGRWGLDNNLNDACTAWDGKKWSDTASLSDNNGNIGVPDLRSSAWSIDDNRRGNGPSNENKKCAGPSVSNEAAERNEKAAHLWKEDNVGLPKSRDTERWLGDMSPDWNYTLQSSENVRKEDHGHITRGLESSSQVHGAVSFMQPVIAERSNFLENKDLREAGANSLPYDDRNAVEKAASVVNDPSVSENNMPRQSFDHSGQSSTAFPFSGLNTVGQGQMLIPTQPQAGIVKSSQDILNPGRSVIKLDIGDTETSLATEIRQVPNMVGGKELTKLTNLSASLAQLLGNQQQLPQIYAALNSHNAVNSQPLFANSEGSSERLSAAAIQPDPAVSSQMPYDPIYDNIELKNSNNPMCLFSNRAGNTSVDGKIEKPSIVASPASFPGGANGNDCHLTHNSEEPQHKNNQLSQLEPGGKSVVPESNNKLGTEKSKNAQEENKSLENDPLEGTEKDGGDDGQKFKEAKGSRAFKFALVEFIKELLKPSWKDGQISKDAYKTIVKKVVDKVTSTMQGANIPQTQEKIDHYLSFSKPKLTKLVQAYVEKMQKG